MESETKKRIIQRDKRALRVRKHLRGSADKPRLSVSKTNVHISVQLIDDEKGVTLASAGSMQKNMGGKKSKETARLVGSKIAELAKQKQIQNVVFDRGSNKYHGLIRELAGAAREAGLQF
jgi:large subunit ribosomal protein L18